MMVNDGLFMDKLWLMMFFLLEKLWSMVENGGLSMVNGGYPLCEISCG
jgi:hypothetical protein